ncbi:MAG: hypothetical protein HZB26_24115 [Candidatus Hydrogenedentes bacterium]|nr:hypothetical protein [Candidatus Hydrogenedentota bacterium]
MNAETKRKTGTEEPLKNPVQDFFLTDPRM